MIDEIMLSADFEIKTIARMMPDGSERETEYQKEDERVKINLTANVLDPVVLLIS